MSQVSRDQLVFPGEFLDCGVDSLELAAKRGVGGAGVQEVSEAFPDEAVVDSGEEHRELEASGGHGVAVRARDSLDKSVEAWPA